MNDAPSPAHPDDPAPPTAGHVLASSDGTGAKKPYQAPTLIVYGNVSEITRFLPLHEHHHHWGSRW